MHGLMRNTGVMSVLMLCTLPFLLFGCFTQPRTAKEIKETREPVYKGYDEPERPEEQVAWLDWGHVLEFKKARGHVVSIDNSEVNPTRHEVQHLNRSIIFSAAELLPGEHVIDFECIPNRSQARSFQLKANFTAGHIYRIRCDAMNRYATHPYEFATEIIDLDTGELIAGRPIEALDWSWPDIVRVVGELQNHHASRQKVEEMFSTPAWSGSIGVGSYIDIIGTVILDRNHTMVYVFRTGLLGGLVRYPGEPTGLLFLSFDQSDRLVNSHHSELPYKLCLNLSLPPAYYSPQKLLEDYSCRYFAYALAIADFLAASGNALDSYKVIERSLLLKTTLDQGELVLNSNNFLHVREESEELQSKELYDASQKALRLLILEAKDFFDTHPEVIASSQDIFGDVEMRWLQQAMGKDFAQSLQKRLLIYKEFVSPQAFSEAQERMKILK